MPDRELLIEAGIIPPPRREFPRTKQPERASLHPRIPFDGPGEVGGEREEFEMRPWPDPPAEEAFYGLAGDIVKAIEPHTEADPVALLVQFLAAFGSTIGRSAYFEVEADRHYANLFAVLVGTTAKARKGTSWSHVKRLFEAIDHTWAMEHIATGLSSGEGLIWAVRDPIIKRNPVKEKGRTVDYEDAVEDAGVSDKRLLVYQSEFASILRVLAREGNTLSAIVREAWDNGNLRSLTKNSPAVATGAHISIIAHVTKDELLRNLTETEAGNGFANRFLWVCVKRSKLLPEGGRIEDVDFGPLLRRLEQSVQFAKNVDRLEFDEEARELWREAYARLAEGVPGLLGAVTARAEAQVIRISLLYALLDLSTTIRREHIAAALALWEYCEQSAKFIFGEALGDAVADEILEALRKAGAEGLTRTQIHRDVFGCNQPAKRINSALSALQGMGLVRREAIAPESRGRPGEIWYAE